MQRHLHIDIETYSSVDLVKSGAYKYAESEDFEVLMIAYALDNDPVRIIDLTAHDVFSLKEQQEFVDELTAAMEDPNVVKHAHNAAFERICLSKIGLPTKAREWRCSAVHAAYCGLPLSLSEVSKALNLGSDKAKLATGKALSRYFSIPCKPTKANGGRTRNMPEHDLDKWGRYKDYCIRDVEAEREIGKLLENHAVPAKEQRIYEIDQDINDRGVLIDKNLALSAFHVNEEYTAELNERVKHLTGVENPGSVAQLKAWLTDATGETIKSLAKDAINQLLEESDDPKVLEVLRLRQMLSKSSIKKYTAMLNCICRDGRGHGFFQFYGANRTGRWAGRLVQLQNLTRNYLPDLETAREAVKTRDHTNVELLYGKVSDTLSQLVRTALIAPDGYTFAVADFSAIEARVIAWLAEEEWRLEVFRTHGKIYEASASSMFDVPLEEIGKGSELRQKGKVAELALGYQGSTGALKTMGADKMGLSDTEMDDIVKRWREASPAIVQLWKDLEGCAKKAVRYRTTIKSKHRGLEFSCDSNALRIKLPSGRDLFYREPQIRKKLIKRPNGDSFETESITYMGVDQTRKQWTRLDTYGGKLTENIVQAIARDLLAESLERVNDEFDVVMHVHDEVVAEVPLSFAKDDLEYMCALMTVNSPWSEGLPMEADGYLTPFYKKD